MKSESHEGAREQGSSPLAPRAGPPLAEPADYSEPLAAARGVAYHALIQGIHTMVGPVLYLEMLLGSRRGKNYIFRWLYAGWLIVQLSFFYFIYQVQFWASKNPPFGSGRPDTNLTAEFAQGFVEMFVSQQLILLLLATPTFAAGAITDEKTRGTLQYMLTADLNGWHIVLGKLLGRTAQVALLAVTGLPVLCFIGAFGGVGPLAMLGIFAVIVLPLFALGAGTLLASVWSRQTRDAVLGLYTVGGLGYLAVWWFGGFLRHFDPLYVLEPAWGSGETANPAEFGRRLFGAAVAWGSIAVACTALAAWRLRPAYIRQIETEGRRKRARWWRAQRDPISDEPIRWKERQVEGLAPINVLRTFPRWIGLLFVFVVTAVSSVCIIWVNMPGGLSFVQFVGMLLSPDIIRIPALLIAPVSDGFFYQGVIAMLLASLVVAIRCSGAVSGERERQTWEALLLTPLPVKQLIRGKLWGIIGATYPYLITHAVPALGLAVLGGLGAFCWTLLWLATTFLAMYFVGATGIMCSVRARSSWRSLMGTLGVSYLGGAILYALCSPVIFILAAIIALFLYLADQYLLKTGLVASAVSGSSYWDGFRVASCLVLAAIFFGLARYFLADAQRWVAERERTRHWKEEPIYYVSRRRGGRTRSYR